jgi:hypothetical protein
LDAEASEESLEDAEREKIFNHRGTEDTEGKRMFWNVRLVVK